MPTSTEQRSAVLTPISDHDDVLQDLVNMRLRLLRAMAEVSVRAGGGYSKKERVERNRSRAKKRRILKIRLKENTELILSMVVAKYAHGLDNEGEIGR